MPRKPWAPFQIGQQHFSLHIVEIWEGGMFALSSDTKGPHLREGGLHMCYFNEHGARRSKVIRAVGREAGNLEIAIALIQDNKDAILSINGQENAVTSMHKFLASLGSTTRRIGEAKGLKSNAEYSRSNSRSLVARAAHRASPVTLRP